MSPQCPRAGAGEIEVGDSASRFTPSPRCPIFGPPDSGAGEEQPKGRKRGAFLGNAEARGIESRLDGGPARSSTKKRKKEAASEKSNSQPQTQLLNTFKAPGLPKEWGGWLRHRRPGTEHRLVRTEPHLQGNHSHSQRHEQAAQPRAQLSSTATQDTAVPCSAQQGFCPLPHQSRPPTACAMVPRR